ncbi:MAG: transcriptional repressor [Candidatus Dadabacteria bacterium]|nr:MAG: transcriptional repressor [Candidatus Dadabacteria bacterium]
MADASFQERLEAAQTRLRAYLREQGLRPTRQRQAILQAFLAENAHVSVDELYHRLRGQNASISHSTVYRALALFAKAGIAKERRFHEGRVRYEPAIGVDHHDHLVCLRCGHIEEFEHPTIERLQRQVAAERGFTVRYHRLELYGLCPRCAGSDGAPKKISREG